MTQTQPQNPKIKRHVVSDLDGTQQGGLVFCIMVLVGIIVASVAHPLALTSFWVWFAMLSMAVSVAVGVQQLFRRVEETDEE